MNIGAEQLMRRVVFVCSRCGTGFLRYPPQGIHPEAMWSFIGGDPSGEDCFGKVVNADPAELERKLAVDTDPPV